MNRCDERHAEVLPYLDNVLTGQKLEDFARTWQSALIAGYAWKKNGCCRHPCGKRGHCIRRHRHFAFV